MPDGVLMEFVRSLGSRIQWECPECDNRTMTAKNVVVYCTACGDDDE